ncbi:MAG: hypothetical protein M1540_02285 [Candidatus Bathyarchaeota archaeon]|nr:hypothetical protein [Candidatus Bathyarchaeota archaeon]
MEVCCSCGGNRTAHTETDVETQAESKKQSHPQADMWCAVNQNTHIKNAEQNLIY